MYLAKVEEYFTQKRGQGLMLSPKDWQLVQGWEQAGIPLPVVLRGINRTFEHADSGKQIRFLSYCESEIKNLWQEYKQQREGACIDDTLGQEVSSCSRLAELKKCLEASLKEPYFPEIIEKLQQFKLSFQEVFEGQPDNWEHKLESITKKLVCCLKELIASQEWAVMEAEVKASLQGYETRMTKEAYWQTFDNLVSQRLLQRYNLTPFSFYVD